MLGVLQGAVMGILTDHKYASTLPEAAAFAVNGGLDLEDANNAKETVFGGIADGCDCYDRPDISATHGSDDGKEDSGGSGHRSHRDDANHLVLKTG